MTYNYQDERISCFGMLHYYEVDDIELTEVCKDILGNNSTGNLAIDCVKTAKNMSRRGKNYRGEASEYFYRSKSLLIKIAIEEFIYNNWKVGWYEDERNRLVVTFILPNFETISLHFVDYDNDFDLSIVQEDLELRKIWESM